MGNNGIAGTDLIIAVNIPASCHHYTVIGKSTSFRNQELICKGLFLPPNTYDCGSFVVN